MNLATTLSRAVGALLKQSPPPAALAAQPVVDAPSLYIEEATNQWVEWLVTVPDPDAMLQAAGMTRQDLRILTADDEIMECWLTRLDALVSVPWRLEPYDAGAKKIEAELAAIWRDFVSWVFEAIPYGYSVVELVYQDKAGGWKGLATKANPNMIDTGSIGGPQEHYTCGKPFEWFQPTPKHGLRYYPIDGTGGAYGIRCDPLKYILTANLGSYLNPYGEALLSRLYWPVEFRKNGWKAWVQFLDRFGDPIISGAVGNPTKFVQTMRGAGFPWAIGVGKDEKADAIYPTGKNEFPTLEEAVCRRIQKLWLGQTGTTGVDKGNGQGSYAALKVLDGVRADKLASDIAMLRDAGQKLVNALCVINSMGAYDLVLSNDSGLDMDQAEFDAKLAPVLTASGLSFSREHFVTRYPHIEEADLGEPAPTPAPAKPPAAPMALPPSALMSLAAPGKAPTFTPEQMAVESLADELLAKLGSPIADEAIASAIRGARDPEDLEARLAAVLAGADAETFRRTLEKALFAADVMGYAHGG